MSNLNLFETATRQNFLFKTSRGNVSVSDLWTLPLTSAKNAPNLNDVAVAISDELDTLGSKSFVNTASTTPQRQLLQQKLDVVLRIIQVRQEENQAARDEKANADRRAALLSALEAKREASIQNMSEEEIQAELAKLA